MISGLKTSCHSPRSAQLYNAYASLQLFARSEIVGCVPEAKIWRVRKFVRCADVI
jgi:hypothetical protein